MISKKEEKIQTKLWIIQLHRHRPSSFFCLLSLAPRNRRYTRTWHWTGILLNPKQKKRIDAGNGHTMRTVQSIQNVQWVFLCWFFFFRLFRSIGLHPAEPLAMRIVGYFLLRHCRWSKRIRFRRTKFSGNQMWNYLSLQSIFFPWSETTSVRLSPNIDKWRTCQKKFS